MAEQKTDWGKISWLEDENPQGIQTGIVTLLKNAHQPKHIHYEEQVIYVIQGEALSIINGQEFYLKPGDIAHWKAGVEHEIFNKGNGDFQHLLVSNPVQEERLQLFPELDTEEDIFPDLIYVAVEAIRTQFLETLHYGYVIFDSLGNLILQSKYMPEYCEQCCRTSENPGKCYCMRQLPQEERNQEAVFECPCGMEIFHYPICFKNNFLGYIQSGYIRHASESGGVLIKEVYDVPESVVIGIKALMKRILKAIRNYCEFEQFRKGLMEKELRISANEEIRQKLMQNLQETQYAVTDLKINHHFLFNTLNSMASMALDSDAMKLYQSIVNLSKMFRYTLRTQNSIVPLQKETEYVKAYLQLQKLRYEEDLEIMMQISPESQSALVPFNFLQPVVENVFFHGFKDCIKKKISIETKVQDNRLLIQVTNTGNRLTEEMIRTINFGIHSNTSHGLSMVYQKLQVVCKDDFEFRIMALHNGNTCFYINIPFNEQTEERSFL